MDVFTVMKELELLGSEETKRVLMKHGAREPFFGVKVGDMKKILKKTKANHELALQLYETGNGDAMYLAGLMADPKKVTVGELDRWVEAAAWYMVSEYAVAGVAAESPHGWKMGRKWIGSKHEHVASAGWATLSGVVSFYPDEELSLAEISELVDLVEQRIHESANRVRYTMNGFVICVGSYVIPHSAKALAAAKRIGKVKVDMGGTACKVPFGPETIQKIIDMGRLGLKRKHIRC